MGRQNMNSAMSRMFGLRLWSGQVRKCSKARCSREACYILTCVDELDSLGHEKMTTHGSDTMLDEGRQDLLP